LSDMITILRCARNLRLAKTIRADRTIVDYDQTRTYDGWSVPLSGLDDIHALLGKIIYNPRLAAVRGELLESPAHNIRRLVHTDPKTGDTPTLHDVPRQWLALDIEGVQGPFGFDTSNLSYCGEHCRRKLGHAFRSAASIVQATAGHGIKPDLRLRLWFWLSRPITTVEAKLWFEHDRSVDQSTLRPAQIIYTAAPIFEKGRDHLLGRLAMLNGTPEVQTPSQASFESRHRPVRKPLSATEQKEVSNARAWAPLRNATAAVSNAPVTSRHNTCVSEAARLALYVKAGSLTARAVIDALSGALEQAGKTKEEGVAIVEWALAKEGAV
jgi:hypothetical protein